MYWSNHGQSIDSTSPQLRLSTSRTLGDWNGVSVIGMHNDSPTISSHLKTASFRTNPREAGGHRLTGKRSTGFNPRKHYPAISTTLSRDRHKTNSNNGEDCKSVKAYCNAGTSPHRQGRCSAGKTLHLTQIPQCWREEAGRSLMRGLLAVQVGFLGHLFYLSCS